MNKYKYSLILLQEISLVKRSQTGLKDMCDSHVINPDWNFAVPNSSRLCKYEPKKV